MTLLSRISSDMWDFVQDSTLGTDVGSAIVVEWPEYESVAAGERDAIPSMMQRDVLAQVQVGRLPFSCAHTQMPRCSLMKKTDQCGLTFLSFIAFRQQQRPSYNRSLLSLTAGKEARILRSVRQGEPLVQLQDLGILSICERQERN
jgi:hypothetical protein